VGGSTRDPHAADDKQSIDLICIYCPDTRLCYYLEPLDFRKTAMLRLTPPRNHQVKRIAWAKDFTEIPERLRGVRGTS